MGVQPHELLEHAIRQAPCDMDRLLCWIINSVPPWRRHALYDGLCDALRNGRLTGEIAESVQPPELFTLDAAEAVWSEFRDEIGHEAAENAEAFFAPRPAAFVPLAFPSRWAPASWNRPLLPAEVREALELTEKDVRELVEIAEALVEAAPSSLQSRLIEDSDVGRARLRVAVLPYADGLPMTTLLYAVKDLVQGVEFGPGSFYKQKAEKARSRWIGEGFYNAGYATSFQLDELKRNTGLPFTACGVFATGFKRSLLLRIRSLNGRRSPVVNHLSFVGQFGPEQKCNLDPGVSDAELMAVGGLFFQDGFKIAEHLDPMVGWEIPLILSFAGLTGGFGTSRDDVDGLALTISTDSHLWAASFGLNLEVNPAGAVGERSFEPTFRRAGWDPLAQQYPAPEEDQRSDLKWFIPSDKKISGVLVRNFARLIDRLIEERVMRGLALLGDDANLEATREARTGLSPIARSLLAPLLSAFPDYRGPLLFAPPEAWLEKLQDAGAYMTYRPIWHRHIAPDPRSPERETAPIADFVRRAAAA
jgi:hypothetical protein